MEAILFWIFISAVGLGTSVVIYTLYKDIFDPYDGYKTYSEYYMAQLRKQEKKKKH